MHHIQLFTTDLRYALRLWQRRPGFAFSTVLILSLGIAATTALFSVVDSVLLRPLPYPAADRLVLIHAVYPEQSNNPAWNINGNGQTPTPWNAAPVAWQTWEDLQCRRAILGALPEGRILVFGQVSPFDPPPCGETD